VCTGTGVFSKKKKKDKADKAQKQKQATQIEVSNEVLLTICTISIFVINFKL
jgi:hypothetical protein